MNEKVTRLTRSELEAVEHEVQMIVGEAPTLDTVDSMWLLKTLNVIEGAGRVLTLALVEFVQAFGAPLLAALFIWLESDRVYHGVLALGQHADQALLIAITLTAMNAVLPIYHLRNVKTQDKLERLRWTVRGHVMAAWRRLTARPQRYEVDVYSNPALAVAEAAITWATLFLAFYAVLGGLLAAYEGMVWYAALWALVGQSSINEALALAAGLLLSVGGVFGVQSISHELACRLLLEKPQRPADVLAQQRAEYEQRVERTRQEVMARHMAAKLADRERKATVPFGNSAHDLGGHVATAATPAVNGHTAAANGNHRVTK